MHIEIGLRELCVLKGFTQQHKETLKNNLPSVQGHLYPMTDLGDPPQSFWRLYNLMPQLGSLLLSPLGVIPLPFILLAA